MPTATLYPPVVTDDILVVPMAVLVFAVVELFRLYVPKAQLFRPEVRDDIFAYPYVELYCPDVIADNWRDPTAVFQPADAVWVGKLSDVPKITFKLGDPPTLNDWTTGLLKV